MTIPLPVVLAVAAFVPLGASAQCLAARPGSPYDFVPASGVIFETDFSGDAVGDFPQGFEFKEGGMEVTEWRGQSAVRASSPSALMIPLSAPLPERFTIEIGVVNRNTTQVGANTMEVYGGRNIVHGFAGSSTGVGFGNMGWEVQGGGVSSAASFTSGEYHECVGQEMMLRLDVDGPRLKLYADERRLVSLPNINFFRAGGIVIKLEGRDDWENAVYLTRVRVSGSQTVAQATPLGAPAPVGRVLPATTVAPQQAAGTSQSASTDASEQTRAVEFAARNSAISSGAVVRSEAAPSSAGQINAVVPIERQMADVAPEAARPVTYTAPAPISAKIIYDDLRNTGRWATQGIVFDIGTSQIREVSIPTLRQIAATVKANPDLLVEIQGHTDSAGDVDANQKLSLARAEAVIEALWKDYGVSRGQMIAKGYGGTRPSADTKIPGGRTGNPRVEMVVIKCC